MRYHPVFLDLRRSRCLVVGGGKVARRKVESLLWAGAEVTVISPQLTPELRRLVRRKRVRYRARSYRKGDLKGFALAYSATDNTRVNRAVASEGRSDRRLINIVDQPKLSNFIAPAVVKRGRLTLAISTGGASPALAKRIRVDLERLFGKEYDEALELLARVRKRLFKESLTPEQRRRIFRQIANSSLLGHLKRGKKREAKALIASILREAGI